MFKLKFTQQAKKDLEELKNNPALDKRYKAVLKTLGLLSRDSRHPGLNSHKYKSEKGPNGEQVFEVYAENKTPAAYRIFWCFGPGPGFITILTITAHP